MAADVASKSEETFSMRHAAKMKSTRMMLGSAIRSKVLV